MKMRLSLGLRCLPVAVLCIFFAVHTGCKKSDEAKVDEGGEVVDPAVGATVSGKVNFSGAAPKAKMIPVSADAYCSKQHAKGSIASEEVVVNDNKTLRNVLVYVKKGLEGRKFAVIKEPAMLDQQGCWYKPHVIGVMVNQTLLIRNNHDTLHNIHSQPQTNQGFNFAQPSKGMERKEKFSKEELVIPVKCDVHPWMGGYIAVLSHPYFAVTGTDGSFSLNNLPPGDYEVEAWHEKYGAKTQAIKVGQKETKKLDFSFKPGSS